MQDYIELCQTLGCCRELVQGSVGNISVKIKPNLIILKEPNAILAEITECLSINYLNSTELLETIEEHFFYSLPAKFVVYLHPKNLLVYLCQKDWQEKTAYLSKTQSFWVPCETLDQTIFEKQKQKDANIFYLQNHGIIIASDTKDKIYEIIDEIYENFDKIQISFILEIKKQMTDRYKEIYFVMPSNIIMYERLFIPLTQKFNKILGNQPVTLENNKVEMLSESFDTYQKINNERPSLVIIESKTYIVGESYKKCLEIEQLLESYMFIGLNTPIFESQ